MTDPIPIQARLSLFGFVPTPAQLLVTPRSRSERITRTLLTLVATLFAAPLVFFIPPHAEWVLLTVGTGVYWTRKNWTAEYVVAGCEALCPRCYATITIKPNTTLRLPHGVACHTCHDHPILESGGAPPADPCRRVDQNEPDRPVGERRPVRIWSPAGSDW